MKTVAQFIIILITLNLAPRNFAQEITNEQVLHQRMIERAVTFLYEVGADGTIEGELLNTTAERVSDIQVLVRYSWLWTRESSKDREDPSWANTFTFPVDLKPGDSSPLSIPPLREITNSDAGKFLISAKVMGYTRFKWVTQ
ncbi:MAG: hypothetical protein ACU84Q_04545 [Gammaproteobacteria bacterium]